MASFIYDSVGFSELLSSTFETGIINFAGSSTSFNMNNQSTYTDIDNINDLTIDNGSTVTGNWRSIRFDFGQAVTVNCFAGLFTDSSSAGTAAVHVYTAPGSGGGTSNFTLQDASTMNQSKVWYVADILPAVACQYVVWQPYIGGTTTNMYECFAGTKYNFEQDPDLGAKESSVFGTSTITSVGGVNYTFKRHNKRKIWELGWSNISSTMKTNLERFRDAVTSKKPFLYYDDSDYYRVRLNSSVDFEEVSFGRYQTSVRMIEVLDIHS